MADIMDIFIQFFQISPNLVSKYANENPIYQLFYLFFFPTIFILIFIYLITSKGPISQQKGLKLLVSVAVFAFIIISGYYSYFVMFSEYWLFGLLILGVVYMFWSRGGFYGKEGQTAQTKGISGGLRGDLFKVIKGKMTGEFKDRVQMIESQMKVIENAYHQSGGDVHKMDMMIGGGGVAATMDRLSNEITSLRTEMSVQGFPLKEYHNLVKRFNRQADIVGVHKLGKEYSKAA